MTTAKLFKNGRSQAVRIPAEFRFQGTEVEIARDPNTGHVLLSQFTGKRTSGDETWLSFLKEIGYDPKNRPELSEDEGSPEDDLARSQRLQEFLALATLAEQAEPIDKDFPYRSGALPVDRDPLE